MLNYFRHEQRRTRLLQVMGSSSSSSTTAPAETSSSAATTAAANATLAASSSSSTSNGLIDLVDLNSFNVQLALAQGSSAAAAATANINMYDLTQILTGWMNDSYQYHLKTLGYTSGSLYAHFDTVILLDAAAQNGNRRQLLFQEFIDQAQEIDPLFLTQNDDKLIRQQDQQKSNGDLLPLAFAASASSDTRFLQAAATGGGQLYTAQFKGAALFTRNTTELPVPNEVVQFIQASTLTNKSGLLQLLQASTAAGLGVSVVDLNAYVVTGPSSSPSAAGSPTAASAGNSHLQAIIIVAVVVAAVAFFFLLAAIWWAWRYDQRNREAYLVKNATSRADPTGSSSTEEEKGMAAPEKEGVPVSEIGGESVAGDHVGVYPESVISEDISTSLSQYYRSGLGQNYSSTFGGRSGSMNHLSDAGSVSSMESYGYSLDGYAPSTVAPSVDTGINKSYGGHRHKQKKSSSRQAKQQAAAPAPSMDADEEAPQP